MEPTALLQTGKEPQNVRLRPTGDFDVGGETRYIRETSDPEEFLDAVTLLLAEPEVLALLRNHPQFKQAEFVLRFKVASLAVEKIQRQAMTLVFSTANLRTDVESSEPSSLVSFLEDFFETSSPVLLMPAPLAPSRQAAIQVPSSPSGPSRQAAGHGPSSPAAVSDLSRSSGLPRTGGVSGDPAMRSPPPQPSQISSVDCSECKPS